MKIHLSWRTWAKQAADGGFDVDCCDASSLWYLIFDALPKATGLQPRGFAVLLIPQAWIERVANAIAEKV